MAREPTTEVADDDAEVRLFIQRQRRAKYVGLVGLLGVIAIATAIAQLAERQGWYDDQDPSVQVHISLP